MPDIQTAYDWAIATCNAANVRYSMNIGLRNGITENGLKYYDCSSFIYYALKDGGWNLPAYNGKNNPAFVTGQMPAALLAYGFEEVPLSGEWKAGDILWRAAHTEMVYSGGTGRGRTMGAHSARYSGANQVSINTSDSTARSWTRLFRYKSGSPNPDRKPNISAFVVAAICGCWYRESHINPGIWENLKVKAWDYIYGTDGENQGGYGLGQWTNTGSGRGMRLYNMFQWITGNGYSMTDGDRQLDYMMKESWWERNDPTYSSLQAFLQSDSENLNELVRIFLANWEGVPGAQLAERQMHAQNLYKYITLHLGDSGISTYTWHYGNRMDLGGGYTTINGTTYSNYTLQNVMKVYIYFSEFSGLIPDGSYYVMVYDNGNGITTTDPAGYVIPGSIVTINNVPGSGDSLRYIIVEDEAGTEIPVTDNTFTMPAANVYVSSFYTNENGVKFSNIDLRTAGNGVAYSRPILSRIREGQKIRLIALPGENAKFNSWRWYDTGGQTEPQILPSNTAESASFTAPDTSAGFEGQFQLVGEFTGSGAGVDSYQIYLNVIGKQNAGTFCYAAPYGTDEDAGTEVTLHFSKDIESIVLEGIEGEPVINKGVYENTCTFTMPSYNITANLYISHKFLPYDVKGGKWWEYMRPVWTWKEL